MQIHEAVVLAGGKSSRMGRDKALLPFGGYETLAEYQYRRLERLFPKVSISTRDDKFGFTAPLILDGVDGESSPMIALSSILSSIDGEMVFLLGVDMPFVSEDVILTLVDEASSARADTDIVVAVGERGREPLCALYRASLLPVVEDMVERGNHRMKALLDESLCREVHIGDIGCFDNLNRPQEYMEALSRYGAEK